MIGYIIILSIDHNLDISKSNFLRASIIEGKYSHSHTQSLHVVPNTQEGNIIEIPYVPRYHLICV